MCSVIAAQLAALLFKAYVLQPFSAGLTLCCFLITLLIMQGRGAATGYDNAVALPARADAEELAKENTKSAASGKGE